MNLRSLRITAEEFQPLGPPIRKPTPAPEPVRRPDGFIQHPDGKLSTDIPPPPGPATPPIWPFPSNPPSNPVAPAPLPDEDPPCCVKPPLKVGDRVRLIRPEDWCIEHDDCRAGSVVCVTEVDDQSFFFSIGFAIDFFDSKGSPTEGLDWERVE